MKIVHGLYDVFHKTLGKKTNFIEKLRILIQTLISTHYESPFHMQTLQSTTSKRPHCAATLKRKKH